MAGRYLSDLEAARMVGCPLKYLEKLGIMKMYHSSVIDQWFFDNGLATGRVLVVDDYPSVEALLVDVDTSTHAVILRQRAPAVFAALEEKVFVIGVGVDTEADFHATFPSLDEAMQFCQISREISTSSTPKKNNGGSKKRRSSSS